MVVLYMPTLNNLFMFIHKLQILYLNKFILELGVYKIRFITNRGLILISFMYILMPLYIVTTGLIKTTLV